MSQTYMCEFTSHQDHNYEKDWKVNDDTPQSVWSQYKAKRYTNYEKNKKEDKTMLGPLRNTCNLQLGACK